MKCVRVAMVAMVVLGGASGTQAQWGMSGAPEMIRLPMTQEEAAPRPIDRAPSAMPALLPATGAASMARPASFGTAISGHPTSVQDSPHRRTTTAAEPSIPPAPPRTEGLRLQTPVKAPAQASPSPSMLDQLLQESPLPAPHQGPPMYGGPAAGPPSFGAWNEYDGCLDCQAAFAPRWYVSVAGLMLDRNRADRLWTTYQTDDPAVSLMNTRDAATDWRGGGEVRLGRRFASGEWGLEATFWTLDTMQGFARIARPDGGLSTPLNFRDVMFASDPTGAVDPARPVDLFDNADAHSLHRVNEFYNVELNLLRNPMLCTGVFDVDLLFGVRWFRFREHLTFASLARDGNWWNPAQSGYLDDSVRNDLIGAQVGVEAGYSLGYGLRLFGRPKIGIYNNHLQHTFNAYRGDGEPFIPREGSGIAGEYPVASSSNILAFLTEVDVGLDWRFHPQWSTFIGYRVVVVSRVGLADHQFAPYVADIPQLGDINHNGTLILHGAFAGLTYSF